MTEQAQFIQNGKHILLWFRVSCLSMWAGQQLRMEEERKERENQGWYTQEFSHYGLAYTNHKAFGVF